MSDDAATGTVPPQLFTYTEQEAREYAARLSAWVDSEWPPDRESLSDILPVTRALRGALQMGRVDAVASLASHLEQAVKALHARRLQWSTELGTLLRATVADLRQLVANLREPDDGANRRIAQHTRELARYTRQPDRAPTPEVVPITALFHSDTGPHILYVPVTPQTEFEQQLRERAVSAGIPGARTVPPPSVPEPRSQPRGSELRALLQASVARLSQPFQPVPASDEDVVPIDDLVYSGPAALARARELARAVRHSGPAISPEVVAELAEMIDLIDRS